MAMSGLVLLQLCLLFSSNTCVRGADEATSGPVVPEEDFESSCDAETCNTDDAVSLLQTSMVLSRKKRHNAVIKPHNMVVSPPSLAERSFSFMQIASTTKHASADHKADGSSMPAVAWRAFEDLAEAQHVLLMEGVKDGAVPKDADRLKGNGVFESVNIALPLSVPIISHDTSSGDGQGNKNIVGLHQLTESGRHCLVYGIGIAGDSGFEQEMAQNGCEVHAFDCTVDSNSESVTNKKFTFHNWCIGQRDNVELSGSGYFTGDQNRFQFKSLVQTMQELGHNSIDLFKFDIEGFEWKLFDSEIFKGTNLPEQLSFELHTQGSNPGYVPHDNVKDKGFKEVNKLFLGLYDLGYRTVSKELNSGDSACAEFVMINVNKHD